MNRRTLLTTVPVVALLAACNGQTAAQVTAQVLADAGGIVSSLLRILPDIPSTVIPSATLGALTGYLTTAQQAVTSLSTVTPAVQGATTLQTVENYINQVLQALSVVTPELAIVYPPLAAAIPVIAAVSALLPAVEAFVNSFIASTAGTARAGSGPATMTPAQARAVLGVATLS